LAKAYKNLYTQTMLKFILLSTFIITLNTPLKAWAQERQYTGGMQHSVIEQPKLYNDKKQDKQTDTAAKETNKGESVSKEIWDRYKALASGTPAQENSQAATKRPTKPSQPSAKTQDDTPAPATGFAGIIQNHQKSKQARGQIKSLQITKPEAPEVKKMTE